MILVFGVQAVSGQAMPPVVCARIVQGESRVKLAWLCRGAKEEDDSQACLGYAMARTDGTARGEAEFTQTIQSRDGRRQKSKRTIKNVMSMSMAGRISEEKSSFLSTNTSLIAVLYGVRPLYTVYLLKKTLQRYNIFPVFEWLQLSFSIITVR